MKTKLNLIVLTFSILLSACGTSTMITGSWRKPNATANGYRKIFVAAMSNNIPAKQAVENGLQAQLQQSGLTVIKSIDIFPPDYNTQSNQKKELVFGKIQQTNADGILTIALLRKETENRFVRTGGAYYPGMRFGYYNNFWSYYNNWYPYLYTPGYYDEEKVYYLETNLYDAKSEQLIWSAQSKTYDPSSIQGFLKGYVKSIYKRMVKDGLVTDQGSKS
jgi:hypothetical protein